MGAFRNQGRALLYKSARYEARTWGSNLCLLSAPVIFCIIMFVIQLGINNMYLSGEEFECGCKCTSCCYDGTDNMIGMPFYLLSNPSDVRILTQADLDNYNTKEMCINPLLVEVGTCPTSRDYKCKARDASTCSVAYSTDEQAQWCEISNPSSWPAILQSPEEVWRYAPNKPAATVLVTSASDSMTRAYGSQLFNQLDLSSAPSVLMRSSEAGVNNSLNGYVMSKLGFQFGSADEPVNSYYVETAFLQYNTTYVMLPNGTCESKGMSQTEAITLAEFFAKYGGGPLNTTGGGTGSGAGQSTSYVLNFNNVYVTCTDAVSLGMTTQDEVDEYLRCGYWQSRCNGTAVNNEYAGAWDFSDSSAGEFNIVVQYNTTDTRRQGGPPPNLRIPTMLGQAAKAWWRVISGDSDVVPPISLLGVRSMPKLESSLNLDFASMLGPLFFCWVVQLLLPTFLSQLVYDKERRLRMMMKMHGLGDSAYWVITYLWFLALYIVYIAIFIIVGVAVGIKIFRKTSIGIQIIFYFLHGNCMIAFAFALSSLFSSSRTASICAAIYVFATGLIGAQLLQVFIEDCAAWVFFIEWIPAFALYRGLAEMAAYTFLGEYRGQAGMQFDNLGDDCNGMTATWGIFAVEWVLFMVLGWYLEQVIPTGNGLRRHPLFFLDRCMGKKTGGDNDDTTRNVELAHQLLDVKSAGSAKGDAVGMDVKNEALRALECTNFNSYPVVIQDLKKVFPGIDGGKKKVAVQGLSMVVERGEVLGLLGPNGAGKTTALNMVVGFVEPSAGTAIVSGLDIRKDMQKVYQTLGVCPQHDLLWDMLSGRDHLRFYGRLKGLRGAELESAVDMCLKRVNLFAVGDKQAAKYSGGMKRRLSVAISFIGEPNVVLLDEPSTGLDPNSRRNLWDVVRSHKKDTAIILTTHCMEEAEALCDRLGIFVDGQLVCVGNPKEITSRYGGYLVFQLSVPPTKEEAAKQMVMEMCPKSVLTYSCGGTLKYELPTDGITLSQVFESMSEAKSQGGVEVLDWAVANATLEEVFIKFARLINAQGGDH